MLADRYDLIIFDLDGTLADTREDLASSVNHVLERLRRPPSSLAEVTGHIGNGARKLVERSLGPGTATELVEEALELFLDHYRKNCLVATRLYPGVEETLAALDGRPLAVLSNKPEALSRTVLEGLGIARRFRRIEGGDSRPTRKPDPTGLVALCRELGSRVERALLVGDTSVDVRTARAAGCAVAGVTFGYRPEELREDRPDWLLDSLLELVRAPGGRSGGLP